jgi:hypothetical protein
MNQHIRPPAGTLPPQVTAIAEPFEQARQYLAKVLPWPINGDKAYVNVHWAEKKPGYSRPFWSGRACASLARSSPHRCLDMLPIWDA